MRILWHLTIRKRRFDEIASGKKRIEQREAKPYWTRRLEGKTFDEVHFRAGYSRNAPFMRVECRGLAKRQWYGRPYYSIELRRILEIRN